MLKNQPHKRTAMRRHKRTADSHRPHNQDTILSILIIGFCLTATGGCLYYGLLNGWDSIIPGRTGGFSAWSGLMAAFVIDAIGGIFLIAMHTGNKKYIRKT